MIIVRRIILTIVLGLLVQTSFCQTFEQVFLDARDRHLDFFLYKNHIYNTCYEGEWAEMSAGERNRVIKDNTIKGNACLLVKKFWEEIGETEIVRYWFTEDEAYFEGKVFKPKGGEQTSDRNYSISFTVDLKRDRIKYLSEYIETNPSTGRGVMSSVKFGWIDNPCRGNDERMGDFYVKPGMIAEKVRELLR